MKSRQVSRLTSIMITTLCTLILSVSAVKANSIQQAEYTCNEGIPLIVEYINTRSASIAVISIDSSPKIVLESVRSASGAKYANNKWTLHTKGNTAIVNWGDGDDICKQVTNNQTQYDQKSELALPRKAKSWGGIVRSGPGQNYRKLASLREGERVVLLQKTRKVWNNYPWFKIKYRGRIGYKWGGILCSLGEHIEGTYQICN